MENIQMKNLVSLARSLHNDDSGAAFIEYTVLLGVILVASIATIGLVGTWASGRWTALNTAVNP
jgi:pilus assembly protein Flp/PilA